MRTIVSALVLLCLATVAVAQDVPLGDVARANKQKQAAKASDGKPDDAQKAAKKPRVFTNEDVSSAPPAAAAASDAAPERETRSFKKGIPVADALRRSGTIRTSKSMVVSLEREKRRLEEKADKTEEERVQISNLQLRIDMMKAQIAKMEAELYE